MRDIIVVALIFLALGIAGTLDKQDAELMEKAKQEQSHDASW